METEKFLWMLNIWKNIFNSDEIFCHIYEQAQA